MNFEKWVHVMTLLTLIVGIFAVVFELRQTRESIHSETTFRAFDRLTQLNLSILGEEPMETIAKACETPDDLSFKELMILDRYYFEVLSRVRAEYYIARETGLLQQWQDHSFGDFYQVLSTKPGRAWWHTMGWEPIIAELGERYLKLIKEGSCVDRFRKIRAYMEGSKT